MTGNTGTNTRGRGQPLQSKLIQSVFPVAGLAFTAIFLFNVLNLGFNETTAEPALFIFIVLPLGVLSLILIWWPRAADPAVPDRERAAAAVTAGASRWQRLYENDWTISAGVIAGLVLLLVFMHFIGLLLGGGLFMALMGLFLGYRNPLYGIPIIVGLMALIWLVFEYLLKVPLPKGLWGI
jgi:hypothetical protein